MKFSQLAAVAALAVVCSGTAALARDRVQITGSSTVLPYASIVAEMFRENTKFKAPIVEGGGTGAGMKRFCEGVGFNTPDIVNASRAMRESERSECRKNGVRDIVEVMIGYDGIVFASAVNGPAFNLTPSHVFRAFAAEVSVNGQIVPNPFTKWSEVDRSLPDQAILGLIPGTKHGTREVFDEKVMTRGCKMFGDDAALRKAKGDTKGCTAMRKDGRVVEIDGDYSETLARLSANKTAMGVFGLSFYENNRNTLRVATFQGVTPSSATIASGKYSVSRPLFFYVKKAHVGSVPGLAEFVNFFVSTPVSGRGGPLDNYGLVPDPKLGDTQAKVKKALP